MRTTLRIVIASYLLAGCVLFAKAKDPCSAAGFQHSVWDPHTGTVSVSFKGPATTPIPAASTRWSIFDRTDQVVLHIDAQTVEYHRVSPAPDTISTGVTFHAPLVGSHQYIVSAADIVFPGCQKPVDNFATISIEPQPGPANPPQSVKTAKAFALSDTKGRDDSDVYIAGLLNGAQGTEASYTADIKIQFHTILSQISSEGPNNKFRPNLWFVPSFDFKASTDPKADGNSVTMALAFPFGMRLPNKTFTFLNFEPTVLAESDKQFQDMNVIGRMRSYFLVKTLGSNRLQLTPQPFLGLEGGVNAKTPTTAAYPSNIARPNAGIHVYLNLFNSGDSGRQAFVESEFIRRWPLLGEPIFSQDKSGNLVLVSSGTSPRDYVTTKLEYDFVSYFGITLQHDYGALPPVFTKVHNKYTVGLVLKKGLTYKPK